MLGLTQADKVIPGSLRKIRGHIMNEASIEILIGRMIKLLSKPLKDRQVTWTLQIKYPS